MINEAVQEIAKELSGSEKILWTGRPKSGILFRGADIFLIPFSLLWCGFAIFWEYSVVSTHSPLFFKLWGIPFVIVGLYFVFGRFLMEAKQRNKTYYGLTSERIIIISGIFRRKLKSINLDSLGEYSLSEKSDKTGTITFGPSNPLFSMFGGMSWPGMSNHQPPSFEMIPGARELQDLIRKNQRKQYRN